MSIVGSFSVVREQETFSQNQRFHSLLGALCLGTLYRICLLVPSELVFALGDAPEEALTIA